MENLTNNNLKDDYGNTTLFDAASRDDLRLAIQLIQNGVDVNETNIAGATAISEVCSPEMVWILARAGSNLNTRSLDSWTPLFYAAQNGDIKTMLALVKEGADPYALSSNGKSIYTINKRK